MKGILPKLMLFHKVRESCIYENHCGKKKQVFKNMLLETIVVTFVTRPFITGPLWKICTTHPT